MQLDVSPEELHYLKEGHIRSAKCLLDSMHRESGVGLPRSYGETCRMVEAHFDAADKYMKLIKEDENEG